MRKLVAGTFLTLDGVMQAPGGPNEDRDGGFQHGGWLVPWFDEKFGEIQVHGSGDLLQTLLRHDLVDTFRIWFFPVVIGTGKRLFGAGTIPRSFRLVDTQQITTGAVLHVYKRVGGVRHGEIEVGQEIAVFD